MIWTWYSGRHDIAISGWMRAWLRGPLTDRFIYLFMSPFGGGFSSVCLLLTFIQQEMSFFWIAGVPWLFLIVDAVVDGNKVKAEVGQLLQRHDVILATRAEYIGGHPELPHGRYAYITLEGYRQNPMLTIIFPGTQDEQSAHFTMPLLDIESSEEKRERTQSITSTILATLSERPGRFLGEERITLHVKYSDAAGRTQNVEISNFFGGAGEVRNWRNYLICAQAEAETGVAPYGPWRSLTEDPEFNEDWQTNGTFGNGRGRPEGSAFRRR